MKYTSKLILNGEEYQFAAPGGGGGRQPGANTIAYYNINDNDTNSTIYDLSGNNNDLTWSGTAGYTTDATYGRVATFDGSSYASLSGYLDPNTSTQTVVALFKWISSNGGMVVSQGSSGSRVSTIALNAEGTFNFSNDVDSGSWIDGLSSYVPSNTWTLLVGVKDGSDMEVYINGVQRGSKTNGNTFQDWTSGGYWQIGANRQQYNFLDGQIKTVIFENKAWTQAEVEALAQEYGFTI